MHFPVIFLAWTGQQVLASSQCWESHQTSHAPMMPSPRIVRYLSDCVGARAEFQPILAPLLTPRVVDTAGLTQAKDYIVTFLNDLGWTVEVHKFTQDTVIGEKTFRNIIATRNPNSPRRLVLAAHYDTKFSPEGFIGATDSAVPCAMMLHLAMTMDSLLPDTKSEPELSLQLLFFDGEEAFESWTSTDSLYGSRHLASTWATQEYQYRGSEWCQEAAATEINRIDSFLLLDLLGTSSLKVGRYTDFDTKLYDFAANLEEVIQTQDHENIENVFTNIDKFSMIQDDQVPFYNLGVRKILHMIASPFPSVWHKLDDNFDALDMSTIDYLNKILRVFVYGYLNGSSDSRLI